MYPRETTNAVEKALADLLCLNIQKDGDQRKQSPSSLANLITSPLAWLLNWVGVQPLDWVPETMDPAPKGTLAHEVFELLFLPDTPLAMVNEINVKVPQMFTGYHPQRSLNGRLREITSKETFWRLHYIGAQHLEASIIISPCFWLLAIGL